MARTVRPRAAVRWAAACVLAGLLATGCTQGLIYTHITVPLDINAEGLPQEQQDGRSSVNVLNVGGLRVAWSGAGLAETARAHGFRTIDYADLEILTVLGVWTQYYAVIYGERDAP